MSIATPNDDATRSPRIDLSLDAIVEEYRSHPAAAGLQALAFWAAIGLPFVALALLAGPGIQSSGDAARVAAVLCANVAALVGGQGYQPA